jgi:hypothetical protein
MGIKTEQKEEDIQASSFYIDEAIFFASGGRGMTLKDIKSSIYKEKRCSIFLLRSLFVINLIFLPLMGFYYLLNPDKDYLFGLFFLLYVFYLLSFLLFY